MRLMEDWPLTKNSATQNLPGLLSSRAAEESLHLSSDSHRAFDVKIALNPLIAANTALWVLMTEIQDQLHAPDFKELHRVIAQHIKIFENKSQLLGYRTPIILAANYFLCSWIDEIISSLSFSYSTDPQNSWKSYSLTATFHQDVLGENRFFEILERACEDPKPHIDLLEFAYLCLSLGYQGSFRQTPQNVRSLGQIIDQLYYFIFEQRGNVSKYLLVGPTQPASFAKKRWYFPPIWLTGVITVGTLTSFYLPYHQHLKKIMQPIEVALQALEPVRKVKTP